MSPLPQVLVPGIDPDRPEAPADPAGGLRDGGERTGRHRHCQLRIKEHDHIGREVEADLQVVMQPRVGAVDPVADPAPYRGPNGEVRPVERRMTEQQPHPHEVSAQIQALPEPLDQRPPPVEASGPGDRPQAGGGLKAVHHALQPIGLRPRVGVDPGDDLSLGGVEPPRRRRQDSASGLVDHDRAGLPGDPSRIIDTAVVDDNNRVRWSGLLHQRGQAVLQHVRVVQDGNDDGNCKHH